MGWQDDPIVGVATKAPWENDPLTERRSQPRGASGVMDAITAGWQGSGTGLALRGKLPDVVLDPQHAKWYEHVAASATQLFAEAPQMVVGAVAGAASGSAVAPGPGTVLGGGAGAFAIPTLIRESLMQAYQSNDASNSADFLSRAGIVIKATGKDAIVGAATAAVGGLVSKFAGPVIGATAGKVATTASEIGTMVVAPNALEGKLPEPQDFLNAAILVGGLKGAVHVAGKMRSIYSKTGIEPEQVLADAKADPNIAIDLKPVEPPIVGDVVEVWHASPHQFEKFDASRIGTGQGAASFGKGLYFAEAEGVAHEYFQQFNPELAITKGDTGPKGLALRVLEAVGGDIKAAVRELESRKEQAKTGPYADEFAAKVDESIAYLNEPKETANMYRVQIPKTVVSEMMDWDKPLAEQPSVLAKLRAVDSWPAIEKWAGDLLKNGPEGMRLTGEGLHEILVEKIGKDEAAAFLKDAGIPGIRYLDQASRAKGEGTRNLVLFDAEHARVVARNGESTIPAAYESIARENNARDAVPGEKATAFAESPFAEIPQAVGEPAHPSHVNYNFLDTQDQVKAAHARLSELYVEEITSQRRGTVSWEQTQAEAGKHLDEMLGGKSTPPREPGTPAGAAEILARKQMAQGAAEDLMRIRKELVDKGSEATPEDNLRFLAAVERTAMIQAEFLGARAEAGRALNILKETSRSAERVKQIQDILDTYKMDPQEMARMLGEIDNPTGIYITVPKIIKATKWEMIVEAVKAGMISGPITQLANIMGNTTFMALRLPIETVSSTFGLLSKGADRVTPMEPVARLVGNLHGAMDALAYAGALMRVEGVKASWEKVVELTDKGRTKQDSKRNALPGKTGEVVRGLTFGQLAVGDAFFRTMNERGEAYSLAVRQATGEGLGLTSREFRERVVEIAQNPDADMVAKIKEAGDRLTFNMRGGPVAQAVQKVVKVSHLELIVPFIQTPGNIAKELARMTPFAPFVGEWMQDIKAGGAAQHKALAEVATGAAIGGIAVVTALAGNISGAGDPDPAKKRVKMAAGWQPYSVKVGDTWYSYQRLQPVGTLIGMAADMAEIQQHMTPEEHDKIPKMLAVAFGNAVTSQTFLQGFTNLIHAATEPERYGAKFAQSIAGLVVPGILAQNAQLADPLMREIDSSIDAVKNRIPGFRQTLPAQRDVFGEQIQNRERLGVVSPIVTNKVSDDKVRTEAARLGIGASKAPNSIELPAAKDRKLGKVDLTPEQQDVFGDVAGHFAHGVLDPIVNSPTWDDQPKQVKQAIYDRAFEAGHKMGKNAALSPEQRQLEIGRIVHELGQRFAPGGPK